jgi:hypothetical protein
VRCSNDEFHHRPEDTDGTASLPGTDRALESYHRSRSDDALAKLKLALHHWMMLKSRITALGSC